MPIDRLMEFTTGQQVRARWGRPGEEDVNWGEWETITLYVQPFNRGKDVLFTPQEFGWAEYVYPDDYDTHYDVFLSEDYYMQLDLED